MTTNSVYSRGATDGLFMGLIVMAAFLLQAYGTRSLAPMLLGDLLMLAVPVAAYRMLRRGYLEEPLLRSFSAVWMHGIVIFLCAGLILAASVYVFLRYIEPGFTVEQIKAISAIYREMDTPDSVQMADTFDNIISKHLVPSPISMAFSSIWLVSFTGAMLSMALSFIIRMFPPRNKIKSTDQKYS